ncbi:hypothetical protein CS063_10475 [Sporanaerobium hydrogeniformans]|uniref:Uncharacterized protein n=1 Tax=Sporanaerobium hydrogeniformans TaxID=3072179 RepID=A0AC61DBS9_9FIRM|nr:methyl-accepting chemotaxis protein [Sporanaerobium hydrogeniformans]PHV70503.1 hypothetical protein CS063_10475 [Sporanaerobium hydrogeniformans]
MSVRQKNIQQILEKFYIRKQTKVKNKILIILITSVILVVFFISSIALTLFYNQTMQAVKTFITEAAVLAANNVKSTVEANLKTVEEFASREFFVLDSRTDFETIQACDAFTKRYDYTTTSYASKEGMTTSGTDISDREYFVRCKETGKPVISDLIVSPTDGKTAIVLAAPILKEGIFEGIIIAQANANFLSELTSNIKIGKTGTTYMLDRIGTTIASEDRNKVLERTNIIEAAKTDKSMKAFATVQEKMLEEKSGFSSYRYNGSSKIVGYAPVGVNGWSIGVSGNKLEFLGSVYLVMALIIVLALMSIMLITIIVVRIVDNMVRPLKLCSERIVLLGRGDLHTPFPEIDTQDEIGVMAETTKAMITTLGSMIKDVGYLLEEMAQGNFNIKTKSEKSYQGDFSQILRSIIALNSRLSDMLRQIDEGSIQVDRGSLQLSESAQALAEGATEQASSIEELTATVESVSYTVADSAKKAKEAFIQAKSYKNQAEQGNEEIQALIQAMKRINATSKQIESIIGEIERIASQTNLLALNASIEAARAGEAGRGFAVVAAEIGKLAASSSASAINTRELISKSLQEIEEGNQVTVHTSETLEKIINGINTLAETSQFISSISDSQAETMQEMSRAVGQISNIVQNNSAAAEETSTISQELYAHSESLKYLVNQFQFDKKNK